MDIYVPDYYNSFACKADKCMHSCCVGWEIDIDEESYQRYSKMEGKLGKRLRECIASEDGAYRFVLDGNERCPFLNDSGLCDIIIEKGEDCLCEICRYHPRYRNFFSDRIEMGIGLSCEAAAELVVCHKEKVGMRLLTADGENEVCDTGEQTFFELREQVLGVLQNRDVPIAERLEALKSSVCRTEHGMCAVETIGFFYELECLDPEWRLLLQELKQQLERNGTEAEEGFMPVLPNELDVAFEQIAVYFVYRHTADSVWNGDFWERVLFSVIGTELIMLLCGMLAKKVKPDESIIADLVRRYSAEVEYSEENTECVLRWLTNFLK
ncbi:MAG: flagellin lysine-N-methylase [Clostridia bacterium]|nr:flagellin lysine-N-methylase [Clostridia bacterium]